MSTGRTAAVGARDDSDRNRTGNGNRNDSRAGVTPDATSVLEARLAARRRRGIVARLSARGLWARKRRLIGLLLAVFLGVTFLSGTLGLSATMSHAIDSAFSTEYRGTDVVVRNADSVIASAGSARGPIPASVYHTIAALPGVAAADAEVIGFGRIAGSDGKPIQGMGPSNADTWLTDPALNPWRLVAGRPPTGPDDVVIDRGSARTGHLHVGQRTTVYLPNPVSVTVTGIATFGGQDSYGGDTYAAFTLAAAQRYVLRSDALITQVMVRAAPGVSQARLAAEISKVLPAGTQAVTGAQATSQEIGDVDATFLNYFKAFLLIFAGIALLVGGLSVHNTFGVVGASRVREAALLRALGASRRQIVLGLLGEALVLGAAGAVLGVAAGYGMAAGLKSVFAGIGLDLPISGVVFSVGTALLGLGVGVGVTLLAALSPALRAARVAPVAAIRGAQVDTSGASRPRLVAGTVLTAAGASVALAASSAALVGLGAAGMLVGVLAVAPALAVLAARVVGAPIARLRGLPGKLARRNAARAPRRTANAATALTIGVAVVTLFTVIGASLKTSTAGNLGSTFTGDLVVSSAAMSYGGAGISPDIATQAAAVPQVSAAAGVAQAGLYLDGKAETVNVADPRALDAVFTVHATDDGLAVDANVARTRHWSLGTPVAVRFTDGALVTLPVTSVYQPILPLGDYVLPAAVVAAHQRQALDQNVYVALAPGADAAAVRQAVTAIAYHYGARSVQDRAQYLASQESMVDIILDIVYVMLALAIIIALLGIGNTLTLGVHERTREIGLLRAVGAERRQVRATVRWEAVITALLGTVTGLGLGLFAGWTLVTALGSASNLGTVSVPWTQVLIVLLAGAVAGLLAGARPARRAARLDPLGAIASS
jgi:putative ABC transport system permease protein